MGLEINKMKKLFIIILVAILVTPSAGLVYNFLKDAYAEDAPIECDGDEIEYFENDMKVVGRGDVVIKYKDMILTCDEVAVWTDTYDVTAEGNVEFTQGENKFGGKKVDYNFKTNKGMIKDFAGSADLWYVKGKEAERLGEEETIVRKSYITTCDHKVPHWKISANRVEVYPEKMVNTYNAAVWINPLSIPGFDIPVMWLPFYCHPLDDNRPHVTLIPGKDKDWGYYLLSAWRYNLTPNQKGYFHLDYREKKDLAVGMDYIYDSTFIGKGNIFGYYMNERELNRKHFYDKWRYPDNDDADPTTEREKGLLRVRHQWEPTPNTLVTAELYKYKNETFLKDYFYNEYEKDVHPLTYALASHTMPFGTLSVLTRKRMNRFDQVTELLPEAKLNINNQRIGSSDFYYTGNFKAANMNKVYPRHTDENPGTIQDPEHANVYDSYNQLSYNTKLGFLSVTPYAGTKQTYLDRSISGDESIMNGAAYTGIDVSTKFFKVFEAHGAPLGIEINKLRHIITPTVNYKHISKPTQLASEMLSDGITRSSAMTLGLENKLQTKSGPNGDGVVDLAMLLVNTSYNFDHTPGGQFGDYTAKLELKPYDWLTATSDATVDPHKRYHHEWLQTINNNLSFSFGEKGSLGIGHSYQAGANNLIAQAEINFVPGWKFNIYEDFDILANRHGAVKKNDLKEQEYVITKDLHCWEMDIRYNVSRDQGEEIMLIFRLKAFPDIPFEFGRNYHKPKVGSQGYEN